MEWRLRMEDGGGGNKRLILRTSSGRVQTTRTIMAAQRNWWGGTARQAEEGGRNVSSSQTRTLLNCRRRSGMRKKGKMCSRTTYTRLFCGTALRRRRLPLNEIGCEVLIRCKRQPKGRRRRRNRRYKRLPIPSFRSQTSPLKCTPLIPFSRHVRQ